MLFVGVVIIIAVIGVVIIIVIVVVVVVIVAVRVVVIITWECLSWPCLNVDASSRSCGQRRSCRPLSEGCRIWWWWWWWWWWWLAYLRCSPRRPEISVLFMKDSTKHQRFLEDILPVCIERKDQLTVGWYPCAASLWIPPKLSACPTPAIFNQSPKTFWTEMFFFLSSPERGLYQTCGIWDTGSQLGCVPLSPASNQWSCPGRIFLQINVLEGYFCK